MDAPPIPPYVTSLEEICWGGTLVAVTMAMHAVGMLGSVRVTELVKERFAGSGSFMRGTLVLVLASWLILLVHLIEVFVWAGFFYWKDAVNTQTSAPATTSLCYYFALMDYTTLGSSFNLHVRWRLLEGMIAVAGLLTFAWSTGVLFTLAQEFQDQQLKLLQQRRAKRRGPGAPDHAPGHKSS
jgi:voltage-gated potassium channel